MTIFFMPIEPLTCRYTEQMLRWVQEALDREYPEYVTLMPTDSSYEIKQGQFLDVYGTISWKAKQLWQVAMLFQEGKVKDGDKFLVGDLWFPGIESIKYMSQLTGIDVELWGWHYAGCSDPWDFVHPLEHWAKYSEQGWLRAADGVFVGSEFHKWMIDSYFQDDKIKVYATGLVWDGLDVREQVSKYVPLKDRPKRIIFPHRGAPEKDPKAFYQLACHFAFKKWDFVITSSRKGTPYDLGFMEGNGWRVVTGLTKTEYYEIMASSRVFFSSAYQETFGYALHEAMVLGTVPVCPKRCCYPEMLPERNLYRTEREMEDLVERLVENPVAVPDVYVNHADGSTQRALWHMMKGEK